MAINNSAAIQNVKSAMEEAGFNLEEAPLSVAFVEALVGAVLDEVKKGQVTTTVTGTSATGGPVTGTGTGSIK